MACTRSNHLSDASVGSRHASWNISDPPAAGFALLSPDAGSVGVLCNSYGADGFATVFCAHVTDGSKECFHAAPLTAASSAAALAAKSTQHPDKRALLDAAQTSRKLPLHFALLASPHTDFVNAPHSHPDAKPAVDAAQQSLWPVTLLEASHAASMQFHGQTSSLRDSGVMAAATAAEAGKTRKLGKSLNPERRRAAVVPLLSNGRPANQLMLPAPFVSGTVPILVSSHNALLEVARAVDSRAARLLHLHLPTHAPGATADDADQAPYCMDATVTAPGAGAFHCAAFRAAWATFCAWGAELSCDPSCEVFCPAEHAAGSADAQEPRLDLPPPPADADAAAIEVCFSLSGAGNLSRAPCRRSFLAVRMSRGLAEPPVPVRSFLGQQLKLGLVRFQQSPGCRRRLLMAHMDFRQQSMAVSRLRNQRKSAFGEMASSCAWTHQTKGTYYVKGTVDTHSFSPA